MNHFNNLNKKLNPEGPKRRLKQKEDIPIHGSKSSATTRPIHLKTSTETTRISTTSTSKRKSRRYHQRRLKRTRKKLHAAQALTITIEEKTSIHRSEQAATTVRDKLKQQFGFVADPNKTVLTNASTTLAHTPTWYYFSRPSHLAFHDFTQSKQPAKNLRSLLGLGLKFIPTPRYTNTWKKLRELSMPKFTRAIHLRFHFPGTNTTQDDTYDPKLYVRSNWTPPHLSMPPVVMTKRLENFSNTLGKLFKKRIGKTNLLPYQTRALQLLQQQQDFVFFKRLIASGYKGNDIRGLFHKEITRARSYNGPITNDDVDHNSVILHLPFHPNYPASSHIQEARHTHVAKPKWKMPLEHMKYPKTKEKSNIKRMIIAYKRPMNLGNLLSHRDLATGPPVSSYLYD